MYFICIGNSFSPLHPYLESPPKISWFSSFLEPYFPQFFSPFTTCFLTEKLRYFKKIDATVRYCRPKNKCCSTFRGVLCDAVSSCWCSSRAPLSFTELMLKRWRNVLCILLPFPLSYRSAASTFPLDISPTPQVYISVFFLRILSSCVTYCSRKVRIAVLMLLLLTLTRGRWVLINIFYIPRLNFFWELRSNSESLESTLLF